MRHRLIAFASLVTAGLVVGVGGEYAVAGAQGGIGVFVLTEAPVQLMGTLIGLSTGTVHYGREQAERVAVKGHGAPGRSPRGGSWCGPGSKAGCVHPAQGRARARAC